MAQTLSRQEMIDIRKTILNLEEEIRHPGKPLSRGHDLSGETKDAVSRLDAALAIAVG